MSKTNNFYTLLPSNSCPLIHPDNSASNFIVELQNPIYMDGQWEVALMDFTFVYSAFPFYSKSKIEYVTGKDEWKEVLITIDNKEKILSTSDDTVIQIYEKEYLHIKLPHHDNEMKFEKLEDAKRFGFDNVNNDIEIADTFVLFETFKDDDSIETIKIKLFYSIETVNVIQFKDDLYIMEIDQLNNYFAENCFNIFKTLYLKKDEPFRFSMLDNVKSVTFDGILTKTLGLVKQKYSRGDIIATQGAVEFTAPKKPKLLNYHQQMFIYSSIVEPVIVGDVSVPLLKSIWLEKYEDDQVVQIIVENPMYLPISTSCINNIEINIRDDNGNLINFAKDSKTHLTLHFRKSNV